jgi:hypothetical protein
MQQLIEKLIASNWSNMPSSFKERFPELNIKTTYVFEKQPSKRSVLNNPNELIFFIKPIEKELQKITRKMMMRELSKYFQFEMEEAAKIMTTDIENEYMRLKNNLENE